LGSEDNSLFGDWSVFADVRGWKRVVFASSDTVVDMLGDCEGLVSERGEVGGLDLGRWDFAFVLSGKFIGLVTEHLPGVSVVGSGGGQMCSVVILVNDTVPDGVELVSLVMTLEEEVVSSLVTSWVLLAVSVAAVEWLMDVTHVVDYKTKSKRFALIFRVSVFHDGFVCGSLRGVFTTEPIVDVWHSSSDVLWEVLDFEVRELGARSNDCLVVKMPVGLPSTTSPFVVIWECDALNEWVLAFVLLGERITVDPQKRLSLVKSRWTLFLQDVISHSCDEKMSFTVPCTNNACKG